MGRKRKKKKLTIDMPSDLEILMSQRAQVKTPRGGAHKTDKDYDRKKEKDAIQRSIDEE